MYLPAGLSLPQQAVFWQVGAGYFLDGDDTDGAKDYFTAIWRLVCKAAAAVANWIRGIFATAVNWVRKTWPAVAAWFATAVSEPLKAHPHAALVISGLIFLGPQIFLLPLFILHAIALLLLTALGFGVHGVVGGSPAARYQSLCYGGNTPASSLFAILQSIGTKYNTVTLGNWVLALIRLAVGTLFVYVVLGMSLWW
ncbi:hypothetical protein C8R46DRAFT_365386 [Mycena filopes]|nr:hypothetical protein C8R46DRAFT_365386 [Mycena filopes]